MWVAILYEIGLIVLALVTAPVLLYRWAFKGKYRKTLRKRLGIGFPLIKREGRPVIWIHAVSLGETKAVTPLVKLIKSRFDHPLIIFSTTTETGHVEACRKVPADHHVYLPFDFGWIINPIMKRISPDMLILCESDFWYNLLSSAKKYGAKIALVNGKISVKSAERFKKVPFFTNRLFSCFDMFAVQSNLYRKRFEELGIPTNKITVSGNMKFDGDNPKLPAGQLEAWRSELGIQRSDLVLVIGSSHHPEEAQLLSVMAQVWKRIPNIKVLLVPRHPERFNEVAGILQKSNINFRRLSQKDFHENHVSVVLVDAMGLLCKCYQLADIAIVAGSYTERIGGHNILEPSWYGVPVIFGPYMQTQPDLVDLAKEYGAGLQIPIENLEGELIRLFESPEQRKAIGEGGLRLAADVHGATEKTYDLLKKLRS